MAVAAEAMSEDNRTQFERLTGTQKSAILMMLLGEDEASEIIRNLSPEEVQHLGTAMYSVQGLDQETVNAVWMSFWPLSRLRPAWVWGQAIISAM